MKFELQEHIGKYPVVREIGAGATSRVYLASDPFADRDVAIKVFLFDEKAEPQKERMKHKAFLAEASLAGKLNHPHIVEIYDAVVEPGRSYLVMEYVAGTTLEAHEEVHSLLPLNKVMEIAFKCTRALEYAHGHGVIHRDIKPGNILLSKAGEIKVGDFGAAFQSRHETTQVTGIGSPAYMSPEQIRMEDLNQQTDIYSLGVTMFRLLTGRLPYEATTQAALTHAILHQPPPRLATLRPDLPPLLDEIVMTAIAKSPSERYRTWLEFGKDLSRAFMAAHVAGASVTESEKFNKLRDLPFFMDFGDVALWETVRIGSWRTIGANTVVIREGDAGESFYILLDGKVQVTLTDKPLSTLLPGSCFGEILYFTGTAGRRTTTIRSVEPITVLEIKADALRAATDACQVAFNKAFMRVLIERLSQANVKLAER
ncbi:MAG TPA: protein kinase [Burkholderiales bacterium]